MNDLECDVILCGVVNESRVNVACIYRPIQSNSKKMKISFWDIIHRRSHCLRRQHCDIADGAMVLRVDALSEYRP